MKDPKRKERTRAIRKVERAIDCLLDVQDLGFGCDDTARCLEILNALFWKLDGGPR